MINNLELIAPLMPTAPLMFCHLQIVCRQKDHKEKVKEGPLRTYFIKNEEHLRRVMPEVIMLCEHYGARAYINVGQKSIQKLQKLILAKIAMLEFNGNTQSPDKLISSAAGKLTAKEAIWVIDIDDVSMQEDVLEWLDKYFFLSKDLPFGDTRENTYLKGIIPTVHGCHLLTKSFNLKEFQFEFMHKIDVHKNSMGTLLYYPSIEK